MGNCHSKKRRVANIEQPSMAIVDYATILDQIVKSTEDIKSELYDIRERLPQKSKTDKIRESLVTSVWNRYIGIDIGKTKCLCCNEMEISQRNFHCGHVIARAKGGDTTLANLRPICSKCNQSMGTKELHEFMIECGYSTDRIQIN